MEERFSLLIVSDSHGNVPSLISVVEQEPSIDLLLHAGDGEKDCDMLTGWYEKPLLRVAGNCDRTSEAPRLHLFHQSGKTILLCHGDQFRVKQGLQELHRYAKENHIDLVIYGHTHHPSCIEQDGITYINPGALAPHAAVKTYAIVTLDKSSITTTFNSVF